MTRGHSAFGAPALLALALLVGTPPLAPARGVELPDSCEPEGAAVRCEWSFTRAPGIDDGGFPYRFEVPAWSRSVADVVVVTDGPDTGWFYRIEEIDDSGIRRTIGFSSHPASDEPRPVYQDSDVHLLVADEALRHEIAFGAGGTKDTESTVVPLPSSPAELRVTYLLERLPEGAAPRRPAATVDDPQLGGAAGNARAGGLDLVAGWFDDSSVGDGVFEAHLAMTDLADRGYDNSTEYAYWVLGFTVLDAPYAVRWADGEGISPRFRCELTRLDTSEVLGHPLCGADEETSTLTASILARLVGNPGDGVRFSAMHAYVEVVPEATDQLNAFAVASRAFDGVYVEDEMTEQRYDFALGGPAVWDELNPRLAVPPDPWYVSPFAAENVADTLQVGGALLALATFLVGLVLVARRRRRMKDLFDEVEAVVRAHRDSPRAGLAALGALETTFDGRYRAGKIQENEYQLASQRIATAATRLALRQADSNDVRAGVRP